jgi:hypothetical protein
MGITVGIRKLHGKTMDDNGAQLWKMDRPNGLYDSMWLREQLEWANCLRKKWQGVTYLSTTDVFLDTFWAPSASECSSSRMPLWLGCGSQYASPHWDLSLGQGRSCSGKANLPKNEQSVALPFPPPGTMPTQHLGAISQLLRRHRPTYQIRWVEPQKVQVSTSLELC